MARHSRLRQRRERCDQFPGGPLARYKQVEDGASRWLGDDLEDIHPLLIRQ
jgi:hypothetical protein